MEPKFKADDPAYVPDYGMKGKGNWLLIAATMTEERFFGPFPSDEDAIEFARLVAPGGMAWRVTEMTDPREMKG